MVQALEKANYILFLVFSIALIFCNEHYLDEPESFNPIKILAIQKDSF